MGKSCQEDLLGRTDMDFFPKEIAEQFINDDIKIIKQGETIIDKEEYGVEPLTGNKVYVLSSKIQLRNQNGDVQGLVGINRDLRETKFNLFTYPR